MRQPRRRSIGGVIVSAGLALAWQLAVTGAPAWAQTAAGPAAWVPPMFGDWTDPDSDPFTGGRRLSPLASTYSAFKVAENESPLPMDRLFIAYNFYRRVLGTEDVHRQTLGVEKTVFGGRTSLGLRLPLFQIDREGGEDTARVDDLTLLVKHMVMGGPGGGLSVGLAVTVPTGPSYKPAGGGERTIAQFQPFGGWLWRQGDFYAHGFLSIDVPTDAVAPTVLFNDVGIGYRLRGGIVRAVIPTLEVHVNLPLTHRGADDRERRRDSVQVTLGAHVELGERTWLSVAAATPVTSPRLFDAEVPARFNWGF